MEVTNVLSSSSFTKSMRTIVIIFLLYVWLLCFFQPCIATDVLKVGDKITGDQRIVSAGKKFVLGFFSPQKSTNGLECYIGIWYNQSENLNPETVVWVGNRDNPVDSSGIFQIANDGNLVVKDSSGQIYWSSKLEGSSSRNKTMKLMDSGNLVLLDDLGTSYLWQSFRHPTDTFLPGMKMDANLTLTSWRSADDPRSGSFTFKLPITGDTRNFMVYNQSQLYWAHDGLDSEDMSPVINFLDNFTLNVSSFKYLNQTMSLKQYDYGVSRLLMNYTGEFQFLKLDNLKWSNICGRPADKCDIHNYCGSFSSCNKNNWITCKCLPGFSPISKDNQHLGERFQGCVRTSTSCTNMKFLTLKMIKVGNPDKRFSTVSEAECKSLCLNRCLNSQCQAYSYNLSSSYNRSPLTCGIWTRDLPTLQEEQHDEERDLSILVKSSDIASTPRSCEPCGTYMIPYPLSTGPNCGDPMYNKFNCDNSTGQVSFMMPGEKSYQVTWIDEHARRFSIQTNDSYHCDSISGYQNDKVNAPFNVTDWCFKDDQIEISWLPAPEPACSEYKDCKNWLHSTCNATSEGQRRCLCDSNYQWNASNLSCTQDGVSTRIQESLYDSERHVKHLIGLGSLEEKDSEGIEVPYYTFRSILAATDNFSDSNKLGQGGYGPVYKGRFPRGHDAAVKRLSSVSAQGLQEFKNEVVLIAKLQHRNLVRLRGYSIKGDEKILVYEYMPNKSLDSFIFDRTRTLLLDWHMRFDIILGIARGLLYLHQDSRLRVIHRDLKSSNILLDEEMNPKISDFGLAKIFGGKETEASTQRVVGTYGYMAPEYALDGLFSIKSDVFSFGVVLLEILSGKRNTGFYESKQISSLLGYAWGLWTENKLLDLMDPSVGESCNENQFVKCAHIGLLCVQDDPGDRPTMANVMTMLDSEIATIPIPTQPTFFVRNRLSSTASSSSKPEISLQFDSSYVEGR
ncbi:G-type lectin S-receptor-like serine/threonine-protein kinase At4g03230 isoform X2 [Gastrolobium bilobum]|uniref:G-type lectin S-receptor-like serine/threonine-protein kinase At4g03230 isoform X2 n=1 Tax=Gastrolobium bilobum TaxID=150636 RepID=UPI002AB209F3|nr:G-type lectin S-receptor-like serine/threonine-protein kinase At4g03230 isoform X2 [Gastrolobium bilobum]